MFSGLHLRRVQATRKAATPNTLPHRWLCGLLSGLATFRDKPPAGETRRAAGAQTRARYAPTYQLLRAALCLSLTAIIIAPGRHLRRQSVLNSQSGSPLHIALYANIHSTLSTLTYVVLRLASRASRLRAATLYLLQPRAAICNGHLLNHLRALA